MNLAFFAREEVITVTSTTSVLERLAFTLLFIEMPSFDKVFTWSRVDGLSTFFSHIGNGSLGASSVGVGNSMDDRLDNFSCWKLKL